MVELLMDFWDDSRKDSENKIKTIPPKVDNNINKGNFVPHRGNEYRGNHYQPSNFRKNYEERKKGVPNRKGCYLCGETTHTAKFCPTLSNLRALVAAHKQQG